MGKHSRPFIDKSKATRYAVVSADGAGGSEREHGQVFVPIEARALALAAAAARG